MKYTYLCSGSVYLINPLCFPNLSSDVKEIPNFFDVLRAAWINGDKETMTLFIQKLEEKSTQPTDSSKRLIENFEINAITAVIQAEISNTNFDWKLAKDAFLGLRLAIKSIDSKSVMADIIMSVIEYNEERCGYFASSF